MSERDLLGRSLQARAARMRPPEDLVAVVGIRAARLRRRRATIAAASTVAVVAIPVGLGLALSHPTASGPTMTGGGSARPFVGKASATPTAEPAPAPAPIASCGDAPRSRGDDASALQVALTGPAAAKSGTSVRVSFSVRSLTGANRYLMTPHADVVVVQNGKVVGRYTGAWGGSAMRIPVGQSSSPSFPAAVLLSGCPTEPVDPSAPDVSRKPLPAGTYQIVASLPDEDNGDLLVSNPLTIVVN